MMMAFPLLAAALLAAAAPGPAVEGLYLLDMPETASALRIGPGDRFEWAFSQGALDLVAEGRWTREGDALLLTSDPPVVPPRFAQTGSDQGGPGLIVLVTNDRGAPAGNLDVMAEYADGTHDLGFIDRGEYRFESQAGRTIVTLRLGSIVYDFISESFPVAQGTGTMRFRFEANDVGKADFQSLSARIAGSDGLTMDWRGLTLRYARDGD